MTDANASKQRLRAGRLAARDAIAVAERIEKSLRLAYRNLYPAGMEALEAEAERVA